VFTARFLFHVDPLVTISHVIAMPSLAVKCPADWECHRSDCESVEPEPEPEPEREFILCRKYIGLHYDAILVCRKQAVALLSR